jgi:heat shock protein HtpX
VYTQIAANKRKTLLLMAGFIGFIWLISWLFAGYLGRSTVTGLVIFAVLYALFSYFASAKLALALSGAKPIAKRDAPDLYRKVENLSITAGLPMPKVYLINDPAPNAFATGRDPKHAAVAFTTGLLEALEDEELEGVIAHELSHVGNYDIRLSAIVIMLVSIVAMLSDFFLRITFWGGGDDDNASNNALFAAVGLIMAILAPIIATVVQLAVSRRREYLADATGAMMTRYPDGLARALAKIGSHPAALRRASTSTAHLYIANPLKRRGLGSALAGLFSTHPPIEDRIARLKEMGSRA